MLSGIIVNMVLTNHPRGTVVVPVHASAQWNRLPVATMAEVIHFRLIHSVDGRVQEDANVVLGGSGEIGFIFPQLHPGLMPCLYC